MEKVNPFKYARVEAERRFLLDSAPYDLDAQAPFHRIFDRYISDTRLRLRRIERPDGEAIVYKFGQKYQAADQGAHQTVMTNFYLSEAEYAVLSALPGKTLVKRRYKYIHAGERYSLDIFEGHLSGLILLEIEAGEDRDIRRLPIPGIARRDVTADPSFTGGALVRISKGDFQRWLRSQH